jgi:hypothetical protein
MSNLIFLLEGLESDFFVKGVGTRKKTNQQKPSKPNAGRHIN